MLSFRAVHAPTGIPAAKTAITYTEYLVHVRHHSPGVAQLVLVVQVVVEELIVPLVVLQSSSSTAKICETKEASAQLISDHVEIKDDLCKINRTNLPHLSVLPTYTYLSLRYRSAAQKLQAGFDEVCCIRHQEYVSLRHFLPL